MLPAGSALVLHAKSDDYGRQVRKTADRALWLALVG
jgi:hypothetical protein